MSIEIDRLFIRQVDVILHWLWVCYPKINGFIWDCLHCALSCYVINITRSHQTVNQNRGVVFLQHLVDCVVDGITPEVDDEVKEYHLTH